MIERMFFKKNLIQPPNGVLPIYKPKFPNGSYRNGVCIALWALSHLQGAELDKARLHILNLDLCTCQTGPKQLCVST